LGLKRYIFLATASIFSLKALLLKPNTNDQFSLIRQLRDIA